MNVQEALNIFGLSGELTGEDIKKAYKKLSLKFHPDRNPGDQLAEGMMKAINAARDFLMANLENLNKYQSADESARYNYGEELENALKILMEMVGITFEVIGNWIWISGETKEHKDALKALGCKWASKKKQWFYRPEEHRCTGNRKEHSMDEIRAKYGTSGQYAAPGYKSVAHA